MFSFNSSIVSDIDLVRFHIGDTSNEGHYIENETITYFLTSNSVAETVIICIRHIITLLSTPNFSQDWLTVDTRTAREGYEKMLKDKAKELGVSLGAEAVSTISLPRRADSYESAGREVDGAP